MLPEPLPEPLLTAAETAAISQALVARGLTLETASWADIEALIVESDAEVIVATEQVALAEVELRRRRGQP